MKIEKLRELGWVIDLSNRGYTIADICNMTNLNEITVKNYLHVIDKVKTQQGA